MLQRLENDEEQEELLEEDWEDLDSDDDAGGEEDLADRLMEVDLDNADEVWNRLTDAEKQEFKSIVYNGEIDKIVQRVDPWWKIKIEMRLVQDVAEEAKQVKEIIKRYPKEIQVKNFSEITSKPPAPCIVHNISNVIAAYAFVFRYYNGDHKNYEFEAADNLIAISENLKSNANFEMISSAVDSVMMNCHNESLFSDIETKNVLLEDLKEIFSGPGDDAHWNSILLSALSDSVKLLKTAKRNLSEKTKKSLEDSEKSKNNFSSEFPADAGRSEFKHLQNQSHIVGCIKKLEFYLSFVKSRWNLVEWPVRWEDS